MSYYIYFYLIIITFQTYNNLTFVLKLFEKYDLYDEIFLANLNKIW